MPLPAHRISPKARRVLQWVDLCRYLAGAAISAGILSVAAADPDRVPSAVVPILVAAATAVLSSVVSAVAVIAALRARNPRTVLRSAFAIWTTGIVATVLATILVLASTTMSPGLFAAFFALPFLVLAKPPSFAGLRPIRTEHSD